MLLIRVGLPVISGALTALGIRRGGHNFLSRLAHAIITAPLAVVKAEDHILHHSQKGAAEDALQQQYKVAGFFQGLASMVDYTALSLTKLAVSSFNTTWILTRSVIPAIAHAGIKPITVGLARVRKVSEATRRAMERADSRLWKASRSLARQLARAEAEVARLPGIIDRRIGALHIPRLWHRVGHLEKVLTGAALGALVLAGLGRERCGWGCSRTGRRFGRFLHRLPRALLNAFLEGVVDVLVVRELCLIVSGMTFAARQVEPVFAHIASMTSELISCTHSSRAPRLPVTEYAPPVGASSLPLA